MQLSDRALPDLVHDSKIETRVTPTYIEHIFYEPGQSPQERRRRKVEHWVRDVVLGKGAYGVVYREKRRDNGGDNGDADRAVFRAVKEISKSVVHGEQLDYTRELEAVMKFSHQKYSHCFVRSDGWFEKDDSIFIAMEHIELGDLQRHLTQPLPELEARQITSQVLEGLNFMHDNGFVHRDLKPGNIMVVSKEPRWFVKITDFGISKRRQQGVTTLHTLQRGTLGFAAPEVLGFKMGGDAGDGSGGSYTFAVDMWSLGAVAYYMLTHKMVFENSVAVVMYAMGAEKLPVAALEAMGASQSAVSFVRSLLAPTPEARPLASAATKHEWLVTNATITIEEVLDEPNVETARTTGMLSIISEASVAWSNESSQNTIEAVTVRPPTPANYCPPYVEDAVGVTGEKLLTGLPSHHPYVLDEAGPLSPPKDQARHDSGVIVADAASAQSDGVNEDGDQPTLKASPTVETSGNGSGAAQTGPESDPISAPIQKPPPVRKLGRPISITKQSPVAVTKQDPIAIRKLETAPTTPKPIPTTPQEPPPPADPPASAEPDSSAHQQTSTLEDQVSQTLSKWDYDGQSCAVLLNFKREITYIQKPPTYFVDSYGKMWSAPDPALPERALTEKLTLKERRLENLGHFRFLKDGRLGMPPASVVDASEQHLCFVCQGRFTGRKLRRLACGHMHCVECLVWAFKFSSTDARVGVPTCCSRVIPFTLIQESLDDSYSYLSRRPLKITCLDQRCRKEFRASYAARSLASREWVVHCPHCGWEACFVCGEDCSGRGPFSSIMFAGCPTRQRFRDEMTALLYRQEPARRVVWGNSSNPGIRLDPTPSGAIVIDDLALPDIEEDATRMAPALPRQLTTTKELLSASLNKQCRQCGLSKPVAGGIQLLECGHLMCRSCIFEWFAIGLISPTHVTPLCFSCPVSPPLVKLTGLCEEMGIRPNFISLWKEYSKFRASTTWSCPVKAHPPQTLRYEPYAPMSWKQTCEACRFDYCLRCNSRWHASTSRCKDSQTARSFHQWLVQAKHHTDSVARAFMNRAIAANDEARRAADRYTSSDSDDSDREARRLPPTAPPKGSEEPDDSASSDHDSGFARPFDYELYSITDKGLDRDRFVQYNGLYSEATVIQGMDWKDVQNWLIKGRI